MTNSNHTGGFGVGHPRHFQLEDIDFRRLTLLLRLLFIGLIIIAILMGLNWVRSFYTDWLWFSSLGHEQVLLVRVTTQIWLYIVAAFLFTVLAAPNFYAAYRHAKNYQRQPGNQLSPEKYQEAVRLMLQAGIFAIVVGAIFLAAPFSALWEIFLKFFNAAAFNDADPVFGKDLSFYIFTLPVLEFMRSWLLGMIVVVLLFTGGFYYASGALKGEALSFSGRIRSHALILAAVIFVIIAAGHWLGRYERS